MSKYALAVVDMANDFVWEEYTYKGSEKSLLDCSDLSSYLGKKQKGKLVAPQGKYIISPIGEIIDAALDNEIDVFFKQDHHNERTKELQINGGDWPEHCMEGTPGAETTKELIRMDSRVHYISKDEYNGFSNPELDRTLQELGIDTLYVTGLVREICIRNNVLSALERGYRVKVVLDATVPFDELAGYNALKEMEQAGAEIINTKTAMEELSA